MYSTVIIDFMFGFLLYVKFDIKDIIEGVSFFIYKGFLKLGLV